MNKKPQHTCSDVCQKRQTEQCDIAVTFESRRLPEGLYRAALKFKSPQILQPCNAGHVGSDTSFSSVTLSSDWSISWMNTKAIIIMNHTATSAQKVAAFCFLIHFTALALTCRTSFYRVVPSSSQWCFIIYCYTLNIYIHSARRLPCKGKNCSVRWRRWISRVVWKQQQSRGWCKKCQFVIKFFQFNHSEFIFVI